MQSIVPQTSSSSHGRHCGARWRCSRGKRGCSVECDGGSFEITRDDGTVLDLRTRYLMVGETEDCGGAVDLAEENDRWVTYRLMRAADAACADM